MTELLPWLPVGTRLTLRGLPEQRALGARLATELPSGTVLFLEGELGAGKTSLTQGLITALGFDGTVSSPTYALMQPYPLPEGQALHIDAYRVQHPAELYEMGLDELIEVSRLTIIEWGEALYEDYPGPILRLSHQVDSETRLLERLR
ncbi:tRNA (adenosine(37)-N6)-threonylcarbamoyltransferase complex ATPase subunit type 1 TsaE [Deinococcus lacus]|uniref:tRNA threonylcarbamoyladenosine biosynthesis protein TsaE n=1 Tax=Deinococcus lacus TaxID=392561 RepID=A0ABW1YES8_9DEIO